MVLDQIQYELIILVDLENSRNKQSIQRKRNQESSKEFEKFEGIWKFQTRNKHQMDFGILILVLIALVDLLVFLSFLALLTYFRFCESINCKNEQAPSTVYQVEEVEPNISNSLHHLSNLISNPSLRGPIQRSSSSSR